MAKLQETEDMCAKCPTKKTRISLRGSERAGVLDEWVLPSRGSYGMLYMIGLLVQGGTHFGSSSGKPTATQGMQEFHPYAQIGFFGNG